ncbi:hypothetical protein PHYSODRAFT_256466 [Phytophthora sojae]|uniref:Uncharacterized protein n=1 Tax=Phytophthora sojae (strain P6497) TaxID=1094619 RepID=G5AJ28_PHYSP|nr:hypothetical protein PHYSODRAFT_256466 [Phytophthora sojae]EGZ04460.1 hypothetical protein PHYSODRAFT_256466 [Phytophthora sojae]|eukprot:XP_009540079.1 hypothetical protein PHYSODRAFT_256466 [Phytophthora sojae]
MDDGADVDQVDEEYDQDFSFDFEGEEGLGDITREDADADSGGSTTTNDSMHSGETPTSVGDSVGNADLSELLDAAGVCEGLEAFATPRPLPPSAKSMQRKLRSSSAKNVGQGPTAAAAAAAAAGASTTAASAAKAKSGSQQGAKGRAPSKKESKPKGYATSSNRLGGIDLADFRDTLGRKRALEDDEEPSEASFAKAKRVEATRATAELKKRLTDFERKAELRRAEEEQRRRDELAAREARCLADKAEAEERSRHERLETGEQRRQEKQEAEERARRDKKDARARTQELLLILGALTKKD